MDLITFKSVSSQNCVGEVEDHVSQYTIQIAPLVIVSNITFETIWKRLNESEILNQIYCNGGKSSAARDVQIICKSGYSNVLADKVQEKIRSKINERLDQVHLKAPSDQSFLQTFRDFWIALCTQM
jgi:hypothetical protein